MSRLIITVTLLILATRLPAPGQTVAAPVPATGPREALCPIIEAAAQANALPVGFFVRVIWQESRFRPDAVGPLTRSGEHAQGIAQFMPGTAAERGLREPFNPVDALPKSGALLADLRHEFGNLGLAAAAYNAGPQRVRDLLAGLRGLPAETRAYVLAVTGRPVENWVTPPQQSGEKANDGVPSANHGTATCRDLIALLNEAPGQSGAAAARHERPVPSWCRGLRHPNVSICGSVHLAAPTLGRVTPRDHAPHLRTSSR